METCSESSEDWLDGECRSVSAPTTPTTASPPTVIDDHLSTRLALRKGHRNVKFPEDNMIVTRYFDAPDPYQYVLQSHSFETLMESYKSACDKQNIKPIPHVLQQLKKYVYTNLRTQDLILKDEHLDSRQCEALEEILKRVRFRLIDLDSCDLDCEGASALFDMIEFYEAASHLCIANNKSLGVLGWQSLCRTLKKTSCLQYLDLSNTGLNEQILLIMGRAMRLDSHLVTIHLENAGLYGRRLAILVAALKLNTNLKELYLGDNKITSADGVQIGNLLRANNFLDVLDLRKNHIQDIGLDHICEGLSHQYIASGNGLKILNLSDNQLTSRGMNRLSQAITMCGSLVGLDLSYNSLCNDGVVFLKEGLLTSKTLKYLNLSSTSITCEGAIAIAEFIAENQNIKIVDLSQNYIKIAGLMALSLSIKHNNTIVQLCISDNLPLFHSSDIEKMQQFIEIKNEINDHCYRNKTVATHDEHDELLRSNIESSFYDLLLNESEVQSNIYASNNRFNNDFYDLQDIDSSYSAENSETPDLIASVINNSDYTQSNKPYAIYIQERVTPVHRKQQVHRTVSLGSSNYYNDCTYRQSGRFSVSPVNLENDPINHLKIEISSIEDVESIEVSAISDNSNKENDYYINDLSDEKDELMDLPTDKLNYLSPDSSLGNTPLRRMSTPSLSKFKPKPLHLTKLKIDRNLDGLDLKSSVPVSPTFFARFEFPDQILLKLPQEVEEFIDNLNKSTDINIAQLTLS